jgi:hypothetical protein
MQSENSIPKKWKLLINKWQASSDSVTYKKKTLPWLSEKPFTTKADSCSVAKWLLTAI